MPENSSDLSNPVKPLIPLFAAALFTTVLLIFATCQYETNDDMTMIRLLSGRNGLDATPDAVFLSLPLGALLYKLYQTAANMPWYGLFLYSCLTAGCSVGLKIILASGATAANRIICTIAFLGFYSHLVCQLNFAGVSLFLWLVAIAAITRSNLTGNNSQGEHLIYGLMLAVSFLIRPDILLVSLVFSAPAFATLSFSCTKRKLAAILIPLLMVLAISTVCNKVYRTSPEQRNYTEFNKSRSDLLDLHVGESNRPPIDSLISSGWNIYDFIVAGDWWLHDATIYNKESFTNFTGENSSRFTKMFSASSSIRAANMFSLQLIIIGLCLLYPFTYSHLTNRVRGVKFYLVSSSALFTLIAIALMSAIRFPPRVALPIFCYLILLIAIATITDKRLSASTFRLFVIAAGVIAVATCTLFISRGDYKKRLMTEQVKRFTDDTLRQVLNNSTATTILITANISGFSYTCEATHPLREFSNSLPIIDFPGGWLIASPPYNKFLQEHGFVDRSHAVPLMINNDRVIFSYWQSPTENFELFANNFLAHLNGRYSKEFPGKTFHIVPFFDNRGTKGNFGWIFFRINAEPI